MAYQETIHSKEGFDAFVSSAAFWTRLLKGSLPGGNAAIEKAGFQGALNFDVTGKAGGAFQVVVEGGTVRLAAGSHAAPQGTVTLPDELFHRFPEIETAEIHLATGFQNLVMDHPRFPADLLAEMRAYSDRELANERSDGETDLQFFYKTRKKAWGPFKRQTWDLPTDIRTELGKQLQDKFEFLIRQLRAEDTRDVTLRYVNHPAVEVVPPVVATPA